MLVGKPTGRFSNVNPRTRWEDIKIDTENRLRGYRGME
jgi:hypothetical protein